MYNIIKEHEKSDKDIINASDPGCSNGLEAFLTPSLNSKHYFLIVMKRTKWKGKALKNKIIADARKRIRELRGSPRWLQHSLPFDDRMELPDEYRSVVVQLFDEVMKEHPPYKNREQKLLDLEILISNLVIKRRRYRAIAISMDGNNYGNKRYDYASRFIPELVHILNKKKIIDMEPGYRTKKESRLTRISAADLLIKYCPETDAVIREPKELVELRDERGKLKDYKDTRKTWRIRDILKRANKINGEADIIIRRDFKPMKAWDDLKLSVYLRAVFKENFAWYGRLHTKGISHYQGFSSEERSRISINGDPIVELDFQAMHPHLLYAAKGIQYRGDPYTIVHDDSRVRPYLKTILLCMLNAKDEISAERAANYVLRDRELKQQLKIAGITSARPLIEAFKKVHTPISEYFCKGRITGMKVMNKDAMIALDIVNHFVKQGIPILPVHDSFIVQYQYEDELRKVMQQTYRKHTRGFRCPIKRNFYGVTYCVPNC